MFEVFLNSTASLKIIKYLEALTAKDTIEILSVILKNIFQEVTLSRKKRMKAIFHSKQ